MDVAEFELLGGAEDETRLLRERSSGYSLPLPGHPSLTPPPPASNESPRYDCIVKLRDIAAEYGFRLDDLPTALDPKELAKALATAYANRRSGRTPFVKPLPDYARPTSSPGGAHAIYPLLDAEPSMEQLCVIMHPSPTGWWALYFTTRFRSADVNSIKWGHLRASVIDRHEWDPIHPRETAPTLWPPSAFALPSAALELTDVACQEAIAKAADVGPLTPTQVTAVADVLREICQTDQSPSTEAVPMRIDTLKTRITMSAPTKAAQVLLRNLDQCHNMLDLRGWAWQCAWAIGNRAELKSRTS